MKRFIIAVLVVLAVLLGGTLPVYAYNISPTAVSVVPVAKPALVIKAPVSAPLGASVTITVYETKSNTPVSGSSVWALPADSTAATASGNADIASSAAKYGIFLGETDKQGQVNVGFAKAGQYILAAVKDGYTPGLAKISIGNLKALVIRAPAAVKVLQPFSLRVVETSILTVEIPVANADVWAVNTAAVSILDSSADFASVTQKYGIHLGETDTDGDLNPEPELSRAGIYWLVVLKDGYTPAISKILVVGPITITPIPFPTTTVTPVPTATPLTTTKPVTGVSPASGVINAPQIPAVSITKK
jgi:hypothetical protein